MGYPTGDLPPPAPRFYLAVPSMSSSRQRFVLKMHLFGVAAFLFRVLISCDNCAVLVYHVTGLPNINKYALVDNRSPVAKFFNCTAVVRN